MVGSALGIQHYRAKPAQRSVAMTPTQAHASARANKHASENEHARSTEVAAAPLSVGESAEKSDSATPPGTLQARPESAAMRVGSTVAPPLPTTRLMAASGKSAPSVGVTAAARAKPQGNVSPAPASQPERALADEMEVIDAARVRLRSGDPSGAVQRLDAYARHSDFVRFAPEALYIRMEAQLQLGNRAAAASAARSMTQRFPHAAQAGRAAEILDSLGER
jgi:TolA-binding protein